MPAQTEPFLADTPLKVGTAGDYKPVTWFDEETGTYHGTAIDLIKAFAKDRGYKIEFVKTTWPTLMEGLESGLYQVAAGGISKTEARARAALLSLPVAKTGKVALVRCADKARFQSLDQIDREGVRVVENRGGTNESFAHAHIDHATLTIVPNNLLPFDYLREGKADVMFTDSTEAVYIQHQNGGLCAAHPDRPYTHIDKVFLFRKDEDALRDEFDAWLAERS